MKNLARYITTMLLVLAGALTATAQNDPFLPGDPGHAAPHHKLKIVSTEAFNIITEVYVHSPNGNFSMMYYDINITHSDANISMTLAEGDSIKIWNSTYTWSGWEYTYMEMDGKKIHENQQLTSYSASDMPTIVMPDHDATIYVHATFDPSTPGWEQADNPYSGMWNAETGELFVNNFVPYFPDGLGSSYQNKKGYLLGGAIQQVMNSYNLSSSDIKILTINGEMGVCSYYAGYLGFENTHTIDLRHTYGYKSYYGLWYDEKSWYDNIFDQAVYSPSLKRLILPSNIQGIGDGVFGYQQWFGDNWKLEELTCYALTPPMVNDNTLAPLPANCVLLVPEQSVAVYKADKHWSRFATIKGIQEAEDITVDLPDNFTDGRYRGMSLELLNAENGESRKYVVDERGQYVYRNLVSGARYTALLRSAKNGVIAQTDTMLLDNQPIEMTFPHVVGMDEVLLTVKADGKDVTNNVSIGWTDRKGNRIGDGKKLEQQIEGSRVYYAIKLPSQLATLYQQPPMTEHIVGTNKNIIDVELLPLDSVTVSGVVKDANGNRVGGASVVIAQTVNQQISKSFVATADANGRYELKALAGAVVRSISATGYITSRQELTLSSETPPDTVTLAPLSGAVISYDFTYTESALPGETVSTMPSYSDYQNVGITAYNETTNLALTDISVQYPQVVIITGAKKGDRIRLTASSLNGSFKAVEQTVVLGDDETASVTIPIVQYGGIEASFEQTDNRQVTASLYNGDGKLYQTYNYDEAIIRLTEIPDGQYTLVTMGGSTMFSSILSLSDYATIGLKEGTDYVKNNVNVRSGEIVTVANTTVPVLDESGFYYTDDNGTVFAMNKTEVNAGFNVTMRAQIAFKQEFKEKVSGVSLMVDLPDNSQMVDGSAMTGTRITRSTVTNNRVTIPIGIDDLDKMTRFVVTATNSGTMKPTAYVQFKIDGRTILQPIGSPVCTVKGITVTAPETIADKHLPVSGTAPARSFISVYAGDTEVGQTTTREDGTWYAYCELPECANLTKIPVRAKITTRQGLEIFSETTNTTYDQDYIRVDLVRMMHNGQTVEFDFNHPDRIEDQQYWNDQSTDMYYFAVFFNTTDTTKIKNPRLYLKKTTGEWVDADELVWQEKYGYWYATYRNQERWTGICNVSVDYVSNQAVKIDRRNLDVAMNMEELISASLKADEESLDSRLHSIMSLTDDAAFHEQIRALLDEYGIQSVERNGELNLDAWLKEADELLNANNAYEQYCNLDPYDVTKLQEYTKGLTIRRTTGLTPAILLSDGYMKIETTSGSPLYMLVDENRSVIVDFDNDKVIEFTLQGEAQARVRGLMEAMRAGNGQDFLAKLAEISEGVGNFANQFNVFLAGMANKVVELLIDGLLNKHLSKLTFQLKSTEYDLAHLRRIGSPRVAEYEAKVAKLLGQQKFFQKLCLFLTDITKGPNSYSLVKTFLSDQSTLPGWAKTVAKAVQGIKLDVVCKWAAVLTDIVDGIAHIYHLVEQLNRIPNPCPEDEYNAKMLEYDIKIYGVGVVLYYLAVEVFNLGVLEGISGAAVTGWLAIAVPPTLILAEVGKIIAGDAFQKDYDRRLLEYQRRVDALECEGDNEKWKKKVRAQHLMEARQRQNLKDMGVVIVFDPSGFIYEGVTENRVENATTTIYYKNEGYDEWGDYHNEAVKWDATEYGQQNPLLTDKEGKYQWDVPKGLWQVKVEKDGYETAYSDWLPVPPPQLDVNIGIVQKALPDIKTVRAYEDGIEVEFNKYMRPNTLNASNIWLTQGTQKVPCTIEYLNEGKAWDKDSVYVSRLLLRLSSQLSVDSKIGLLVRRQVESYAGLQMQNDYEQEFVVVREIRELSVEPRMDVRQNESRTFTITASPAQAAVGKKVKVSVNISGFITLAETATFDSDGKAQFTVDGLMPGETVVTFTMEETNAKTQTIIRVLGAGDNSVAAPTASRISGTSVNPGETVALYCATEGAVIYYTLDGSCPCDENGTRQRYTGPLTISQDMELRAYAVKGDDVSEVVSFHYYIVTAIHTSESSANRVPVAYYTVDGQRLSRPRKGLHVVRYSDGTTKKIMVK